MSRLPLLKPALVALALTALAPGAARATDPVQRHNSGALWFDNWIGLDTATLVVAAPDGRTSTVRAATGTPVFELDRARARDGVYRYELRAATDERIEILNPPVQAEAGAGDGTMPRPYSATGFFVVERGVIITPKAATEERG